jgi:hypothetical protein
MGAPWPAIAFDDALVLLYEGLCQRQPEPTSSLAARDQRKKDTFLKIRRDAWAVVDHMQFQCQSVERFGDGDLARNASA